MNLKMLNIKMESLTPSRMFDSMQSLQYIKDLTMLAVSNIAVGRGLCSSDCFVKKTYIEFKNTELKVFDENCQDHRVQFFLRSLNSAFEAISKKFLYYLVISVYKDDDQDHDNLLESYVFEYTYTPEGAPTLNISSNQKNFKAVWKNKIEQQTKEFIQMVILMSQGSTRLPESTYIKINTYYNKNAPPHYQPPNLQVRKEHRNEIDDMLLKLSTYGAVQTPFHQLAGKYHDANWDPSPDENSEHTTIRCVCNASLPEAETIVCKYCGKKQHSICYGLWPEQSQAQRADHCCVECAIERDRLPTDVDMIEQTPIHRQRVSSLRRALSLCVKAREISLGFVSGTSLVEPVQVADGDVIWLFDNLMAMDVLFIEQHAQCGDRKESLLQSVWAIRASELPEAINQTFLTDEMTGLMMGLQETHDTQFIESNLSQDLVNDNDKMPGIASDILRGPKKPNSTETSHEPAESPQLYTGAILSQELDEDDDLPLSGSHNPIKTLYRTTKPIEQDTPQSDVITQQKEQIKPQVTQTAKVSTPQYDFTLRLSGPRNPQTNQTIEKSTTQQEHTGQKCFAEPQANQNFGMDTPPHNFVSETTQLRKRGAPRELQYGKIDKKSLYKLPKETPRKFFKSR